MKKITLLLLLFTLSSYSQLSLNPLPDTFNQPMTIELHQNYMVVSEKTGKIYVSELINGEYQKRTTPIIDIGVTGELQSFGEQGLLDIKLSPNFETDNNIFLYYTCSNQFIDSSIPNEIGESISRVTKYTIDLINNNSSNRQIIVGQNISDGIPIKSNHVGGSLNFMSDGTLLITTGDSGYGFNIQNGIDLGILEDLPYVSQGTGFNSLVAMQINSCNGKVLRVDTNGNGLTDNPFYDSDNPKKCKSRVYNMGLRNPFRARLRNDSLFINNVGSSKWESIFISDRPALNFGWSMREGFEVLYAGNNFNFETGLDFNETFETSLDSPEDVNERIWNWSRPLLTYHQDDNIIQRMNNGQIETIPSILNGSSISGSLPIKYNLYSMQNKYMFSDFYSGIISITDMQGNLTILDINQGGISDIKEDLSGVIYISSLYGQIFRMQDTTLSIGELELQGQEPLRTEYYNIVGKRLKNLQYQSKGVYLKRDFYNYGVIKTTKIIK